MIGTERALTQSQRVSEELLGLRLLVALRERDCQVARRGQRALVLSAERVGLLDEDLALYHHHLGVLTLL